MKTEVRIQKSGFRIKSRDSRSYTERRQLGAGTKWRQTESIGNGQRGDRGDYRLDLIVEVCKIERITASELQLSLLRRSLNSKYPRSG